MAKTIIKLPTVQRLDRVYKSPNEVLQDLTLDFSARLLAGETVVAVETEDAGTGLVTAAVADGTTAVLDLSGGTAGEKIPVTVTVTGDGGSVRQAQLLVTVRDPLSQAVPVTVPLTSVNWRGDWQATAAYNPNDIANHNNLSWLALRINTGVEPAEGDDWTAFASTSAVPVVASQAEAEAGTEAASRSWSPLRVWQAIAAWGAKATSVFKGQLTATTESVHAVDPGAAYTVDSANGNIHRITLTEALTVTLPADPPTDTARTLVLEFVQDATGGWEVTWPAMVWRTSDGLEPVIGDVPSTKSGVIVLTNTGDGWVGHPLMFQP